VRSKVYANTTAAVGCIGVYRCSLTPASCYDDAGVTMRLVKAGEYKGVGEDGVEITDRATGRSAARSR
jgi:ClpP class serine protease